MAYPDNPFIGQEIEVGGTTKQWNGYAWVNITNGNKELRIRRLEGFKSVAEMRAGVSSGDAGFEVRWKDYYEGVTGGGNKGTVKTGDSTSLIDDGGSIFVIVNDAVNGVWVEANLKGKTVNIKKFGVVADGVADDTQRVTAAINYTGALEFKFPDSGVCRLTSSVSILPRSNMVVDFGTCTVFYDSTTQNTGAFLVQAPYVETQLSAGVSRGDGSFSVNSSVGIGENQIITIRNNDSWFLSATRNNKKGEGLIVHSVVGNTVNLWGRGPLFSYSGGNTVRAYELVDNVTFKGGHLTSTGAASETFMIRAEGIRDLKFDSLSVSRVNVGVTFNACTHIKVRKCNFREVDLEGVGYSVLIGTFNVDCLVSGCTGDRGRHFVTTAGEDGISKHILVSDNVFRGSIQRAIDTHVNGYNVVIQDNIISDSYGGIQVRSPNTTVKNNTLYNCTNPNNVAITSDQTNVAGILVNEYGHVNLRLVGNEVINDPRLGDTAGVANNKFKLFGTAIDIRGATNLLTSGYNEFTNEYIEIVGGKIEGFVNGSSVSINLDQSNNNKPDRVLVKDVDSEDYGFSGVNVIAGTDVDRDVDVEITNCTLANSDRSEAHINVKNARDVIIRSNRHKRSNQVEVKVENSTRAVINNNTKPVTVISGSYSYVPEIINVDTAVYSAWGVASGSVTIPLYSNTSVKVRTQSSNGSSFSAFTCSLLGGSATEFTQGSITPSVTVNVSDIAVTHAGTFFWHLEPSMEFIV